MNAGSAGGVTAATPRTPAHAALEQAAHWYALLRDGRASPQQRAGWHDWLRADAMHQAAWRQIEDIARDFDPLRGQPEARLATDTLGAANTRLRARRRALAGVATLAGGTLLGWTAWRAAVLPDSLMAWSADHRTGTGERREIRLADGSRVWLNAGSALDVRMDAHARRLTLREGEAFIATAADATRPFVVQTQHGQLQALGTRFDVRRTPQHTLLAVYEGAVRIQPAAGGAARVLQAGQQARFDAAAVDTPEAAGALHEAWTQGALVADDLPLRLVVDELRRHRRGHLGLADEVAELRVYGHFPIDDPDRVLRMLASALPIRIVQPLPWWTRIEARP